MIGFFIAIFLIAIFVGLFFLFGLHKMFISHASVGATGEVKKGRHVRRPVPYIIGAIGVLVLLILMSFIRVVPVGHALVIFWIFPKTYSVALEGINIVPPIITQTTMYDLRRIDYTISSQFDEDRRKEEGDALWASSSEGLQVGLDLTCWYHLDSVKVREVHRQIGPDYKKKVVYPAIRSIVRLTMSEYSMMDIYSNKREMIQHEIELRLKEQLEPDGITLDGVAIRNVQFSPEYSRSIEEKQIAQQNAQKMQYVLEAERKEAERKEIEATGKAKAIRIVSKELYSNPRYIKYLYVDKLADDVKVIVSDQATIMDLKGLIE